MSPALVHVGLCSLCHRLLVRRVVERARNPVAGVGMPLHKGLSSTTPGVWPARGQPEPPVVCQCVHQHARSVCPAHAQDMPHPAPARCPAATPLSLGGRFFGDVVFTHHRRVRLHVVQHCRAKLQRLHRQHRHFERLRSADVQQLQALLDSYWGYFRMPPACLCQQTFSQMPWLTPLLDLNPDGSLHPNTRIRWQVLRRRAVKRILKPEGDNL